MKHKNKRMYLLRVFYLVMKKNPFTVMWVGKGLVSNFPVVATVYH